MIAITKSHKVRPSTNLGSRYNPKTLSDKYCVKEWGKFLSPNFRFTSHSQSVRKQYPHPFHIPSTAHENTVSPATHKCNLRVRCHTHANRFRPITTKWVMNNNTSRAYNITQSSMFIPFNTNLHRCKKSWHCLSGATARVLWFSNHSWQLTSTYLVLYLQYQDVKSLWHRDWTRIKNLLS